MAYVIIVICYTVGLISGAFSANYLIQKKYKNKNTTTNYRRKYEKTKKLYRNRRGM